MGTDIVARLRHYDNLLTPMIAPAAQPFVATSESATAIQVERGTIYALCLLDPNHGHSNARIDRLVEVSTSERLGSLAVVDRAGHHRPAYRGLLVYSWLMAYRLCYETLPRDAFGRWEEALRAWCDVLEADLGDAHIDASAGNSIAAAQGAAATESAWVALALHVAGKIFIRDAWTDLAATTFGRLSRGQHSSGRLLEPSASDNPETHWYHELLLLHAAGSYAVQAEDRTLAATVRRATEYHLEQTQPDHATGQPWALFPLIWNSNTQPLADEIIHAMSANTINNPSGIAIMLITDALYCLRLFL